MLRKIAILTGSIVILFGAFVLNTLWAAGAFKEIKPTGSAQCHRVEGVTGAEDITIDPVSGFAFISATDRRQEGTFKHGIYRYEPGSLSTPTYLEAPELPGGFYPHGIDLWHNLNGPDRLFVINHPKVGDNFISQVDVFEIGETSLTHIETVGLDQNISLNDVTAIGERSFYASIDQGSETPFGRTMEQWFRLARAGVMYGKNGSMRQVLDGLTYANGLQASSDNQTLYVAESTGQRVSAYAIDPTNGDLTLQAETSISSGLDNIELDADGALWIGAHPQVLKFIEHGKTATNRSPSQVFRVTPMGKGFGVEEIYLNDGNPISGSSVAAPYAGGFLIGTVFEPFILDCRQPTQ